jgi:dihydrofolate reductase
MAGGTTFHFRNAPIEEVLAEATEVAGGLDMRVGGGVSTVRAFLQAGLVDEVHVMITPVVLAKGTRLWDDLRELEGHAQGVV